MRILLMFILICLSLSVRAELHTWKGGTGDYDDPTQWDTETVPTAGDDVFIESGTVIFPAGATYEANNFQAKAGTLDFRGTSLNSADIDIWGDLDIAIDVVTIYESNSQTTWSFMGSGLNHLVCAKGVNLNRIFIDEPSSQIELLCDLIAEDAIQFKNGSFDSDGYDILTGDFYVGGSCLPSCMTKNLNFSSSVITCTGGWDAQFNYGSVSLSGTYTIKAAEFKGGQGVVYYNVELTDFNPSLTSQSAQNLFSRSNVFHDLIVNNVHPTKIAGDVTINGTFEVVHPNSEIYVSKEVSGATMQWKFNGDVDLPVDQGGCLDLTSFIKTSAASDTFNFYTASSDIVFDYAFIQGIPTTGGGSFTVSTGYVAGYNSTWSTINSHPSKTLYWIGGTGDWHDGSHWSLTSGGPGYGCPPSIVDDVVFDANSFSGPDQSVDINYNQNNFCRDLRWVANPYNAEMAPVILGFNSPDLNISGEIDIEAPVAIDMENGGWNLIARDELSLSSVAVLPRLHFLSESGFYLVGSDLEVDGVRFSAGGIETQDFDMTINGSWLSQGEEPKFYNLGSSTITTSGTMDFGDIYDGNIDVDPGTSHLICETFTGDNVDYHIVEINILGDNQLTSPVNFHKLILNGSTIRPLSSGITIDSLILNTDGSGFKINPLYDSYITQAIISNGAGVNPPKVRSSTGAQATLVFNKHNPCLEGIISFENVEAVNPGIVNVPDGVDDGGNAGLSFATAAYSGTLYWIGGQGYWNTLSNWSAESGGCPTSVDPKVASQLVFDDRSFSGNDTIFIDAYRVCNDLLFENTNHETLLYLGRRLVADKVEIDEGAVVISNNPGVQPFGTLWVDENVSVTNGGSLTLDNSDVVVGRRPTNLIGEPALFVDFMSALSGNAGSVLGIAGTADDPAIKTVDIQFGAYVNGLNMEFAIVPPIGGQPLRDMSIDISNRYFQTLVTNVNNTNQKYRFVDDARFGSVEHNYGTMSITPSVLFKVGD